MNFDDAKMSRLIETVRSRLKGNLRLRRSLPLGGRIHIDRPLPFFCVYRQPLKGADPGTERLVMSEASYIVATGGRKQERFLSELICTVAEVLKDRFGVCMVLELWAGKPREINGLVSLDTLSPRLKIITSKKRSSVWFGHRFQEALSRTRLSKHTATVELKVSDRCFPPGRSPLMSSNYSNENGYRLFGLEVSPIYRDPFSGDLFPLVLREFRQSLSKALRSVFFDFARTYSRHPASHRNALGRRAMVKAVWEADRILAEISSKFDFLLQVTPVNAEKSWHSFKKQRYEKRPLYQYRPSLHEPIVLKRMLYSAPVEKIEDPALAMLFRHKQTELDRQITLLQDRNTPRFVHESTQLYGEVSESQTSLASQLLELIPARSREFGADVVLDAEAFSMRARDEIKYYREIYPSMDAKVEIRDDVAGIFVSQGSLLISRQFRISAHRVDALLQHEIGTHVLTYHNGKAQPFKLLYSGLAGYEALQEGLAVLGEYLVGGLGRQRLRALAGRVIAARDMLDGADFVETFRALHQRYGFSGRTAYTITMRIFRGGGLTKDAVYLKGLRQMLSYIEDGGDLDLLYVGKMSFADIPTIRELQWRGVLSEPLLRPRYMNRAAVESRLETLRNGMTVLQLVERKKT